MCVHIILYVDGICMWHGKADNPLLDKLVLFLFQKFYMHFPTAILPPAPHATGVWTQILLSLWLWTNREWLNHGICEMSLSIDFITVSIK